MKQLFIYPLSIFPDITVNGRTFLEMFQINPRGIVRIFGNIPIPPSPIEYIIKSEIKKEGYLINDTPL